MKTRDDIFTQVLVRNNRTTTDSFVTDTILKAWFRDATLWATSFHKWPFTEERDASTTWSGTEKVDYSSFGVEFKADSIRILTIGDNKRMRKLNFEDYLIFREEESSATDRVFSDFGRTLYINPKADVSGTLAAFGQSEPTIDLTDETGTTAFSTYDDEGNEAIYEKMTSYLKTREHLPDEAQIHDARAMQKLEEVWKRVQEEQYQYHTHEARGGMFRRVDVLDGFYDDEGFKRDQF